MKRVLVALVFLFAALSLLIGTPALSSRVSGLTKALKQLPPEDLQEVLENLGVSPVPKTGATYDDPSAIGDDGELQRGVAYAGPQRFTDNGDGTVTDNLTGLVWTKNANIIFDLDRREWGDACADCDGLNSGEGGLSDGSEQGDWRLPNVRELQSLIDFSAWDPALPPSSPFVGVKSSRYWSSTTTADDATLAWVVHFGYGGVFFTLKSDPECVWCVRGGP